MSERLEIRLLAARDSFDALTTLLHRAYAPLAARGMNFTAASQDAATTQRRAAEGQCFVAEYRGRIVGTVTVCGAYDLDHAPWSADVPAYRDRDTAHLDQFAVDPAVQRRGVGRRLVAACERWAREHGYKRLALDVAEPATELCAMYRRLGYTESTQVQWKGRSYRSVVMEKPLDHSPLREHLRLMARYHLWATRVLLDRVDALSDTDHRRDVGLPFKSVHGTLNHLLLVEHEVWHRRFTEGVSEVKRFDTELEPDRARLRERLLDTTLAWLPLIEVWSEARLLGSLEYRTHDGGDARLPFAAALLHVFNHGTHHRGQISAALSALGQSPPDIDLAVMLTQDAGAA